MPEVRVLFYREDDDSIPALEWLDGIQARAKAKCLARVERLRALGHELRRPEADYLRDGIYELRFRVGRVQYRSLYFFHGRTAVVISHGFIKEAAEVRHVEIERALRLKQAFGMNPQLHTHRGAL